MASPRIEIPADSPDHSAYALLTSLVVPRPIAWVSTLSADGVGNLAPHSFFTVAQGEPPVVIFTTLGRKDTLTNIEATGEFVINLATESMMRAINNSAARFSPDVDEAHELGVELEPSVVVAPPRVRDSPAVMECRLRQIIELESAYVVLGEVSHFAIRQEAWRDGAPSYDDLRPLSRLGGSDWGLPPEAVTVPRPVRPDDIDR